MVADKLERKGTFVAATSDTAPVIYSVWLARKTRLLVGAIPQGGHAQAQPVAPVDNHISRAANIAIDVFGLTKKFGARHGGDGIFIIQVPKGQVWGFLS